MYFYISKVCSISDFMGIVIITDNLFSKREASTLITTFNSTNFGIDDKFRPVVPS